MKDVTTVLDPRVGDKMNCPGCDCPLTLTPAEARSKAAALLAAAVEAERANEEEK